MKSDDDLKKLEPLFSESRPQSHVALQTQAEIRAAALKLLNAKGSGSVTTHDIAEEAGISPGNLYYHYKNKEEIIRAIFWQIDLFSQFEWAGRGPLNPKEGISGFLRFFFGELHRYKFFFRDFAFLLRADPLLARLWQLRYEQLFTTMRQAATLWVKAGIMKPFVDDNDVDCFIENFWILANFSGIHLENRQQKTAHRNLELLIKFLYPYHTDKGRRALDIYFIEN